MRSSSNVRAPVVLVTGCSSGIGKTVCDHLAARGKRVFGASRSISQSSAWTYLPIDVTNQASIDEAVASIQTCAGRIDVLVTAAGESLMGALEDTTIDEAKQHFDVNFFGTIRSIKSVLPIMRGQHSGKIILIGSIGGQIGLPYLPYYSAAKFALNGLAEALRTEVEPFGIQVTILNPGYFKTNISVNERHASNSRTQSPYFPAHQRARNEYGRLVEEAPLPHSVARAVDHLLSNHRLPVRLAVGSPVERLGLLAKRLLSAGAFEFVLRKNQGL